MALLTGLKYGWQDLPTVKDAQLWIHAKLNTILLVDMARLFFAMALMTNINRFIQCPCTPATDYILTEWQTLFCSASCLQMLHTLLYLLLSMPTMSFLWHQGLPPYKPKSTASLHLPQQRPYASASLKTWCFWNTATVQSNCRARP